MSTVLIPLFSNDMKKSGLHFINISWMLIKLTQHSAQLSDVYFHFVSVLLFCNELRKLLIRMIYPIAKVWVRELAKGLARHVFNLIRTLRDR